MNLYDYLGLKEISLNDYRSIYFGLGLILEVNTLVKYIDINHVVYSAII
jgi:hypothetical protein